MAAFYALPSRFAASLFTRLSKVVAQIMAGSRSLERMKEEGGCPLELPDGEMPVRTVFPFFVKVGSGRLRLTQWRTCTAHSTANSTSAPATRSVARRQRFATRTAGETSLGTVLRLAIGARIASEVWHTDDAVIERNVQRVVDNMRTVTAKIDFLAEQS